jgi:hypothetical protein
MKYKIGDCFFIPWNRSLGIIKIISIEEDRYYLDRMVFGWSNGELDRYIKVPESIGKLYG